MALLADEPPLKRRREDGDGDAFATVDSPRYAPSEDMEMSPEPSTRESAAAAADAQGFSDEDTKRRNQREVLILYRAYTALKSCLIRHPGPELDRDLEKAYFTVLNLANGCINVRRISAELISRYAAFCPTALDPASRVILQNCEWTSSVLMQAEECDAIVTETAEACFSGLVELCVAANDAARSFFGLRPVCAGVWHTLAAYLIFQLNGNALVHEEDESCSRETGKVSGPKCFGRLISRTLAKLFCVDPENVIASCLKLLQTSDDRKQKHVHHFLSQLAALNRPEDEKTDGTDTTLRSSDEPEKSDAQDAASQEKKEPSKHDENVLLSKVLHLKPGLERRIVSMIRGFRTLENTAVVEESLPYLLKLVKSFKSFTPADLELTTTEELEPLKSPEVSTRGRSRSINKFEDGYDSRARLRPGEPRLMKGLSVEVDPWSKDKDRSRKRSVTIERSDTDVRRDRRESSYSEDMGWPSGWRGRDSKQPSSALSSPQQQQKASPTPGPVFWYRDGDPASMDVYAATEHLWIGISSGVSEAMLRAEFSRFGQLESSSLFREQGFALLEYKIIREAVEARETLQGSTIWGKQLRIKFLDPGLGSKGTLGGAALGTSRHAWVGRIYSQISKEELLKDLAAAGFRPAISITTLIASRALMLEYDSPEEAGAVMLHIRQRRRDAMSRGEGSGSYGAAEGLNRHLWIGQLDPFVPEEELLSAFSQYGEITGYKFLRGSCCCFIDFRSSEVAAAAKARLDGARFGNHSIVVEFKNSPQKHPAPASSPPPSFYSPPRRNSLSATLDNLCGKFALGGTLSGQRQRNSRFTIRESDRVPTNTLWIGLPEATSPGFMNENDLRSIFSLACDSTGTVTKVRSARTSRGPCRFVEFDGVEAAARALQNICGRLDPGIQIEFSNSSISLQHPPQYDHTRRKRGWDWDQQQQEAYEGFCSPSGKFAESKSQRTGWGEESRRMYENTAEENGRCEPFYRKHSPSVGVHGDSTLGSPAIPGRASMERQTTPLNSQVPPLAPLPTPPGFGHMASVTWQASSPMKPISPASSTPTCKAPRLRSPAVPAIPYVSTASFPPDAPPRPLPPSPPPPLPCGSPPPPPSSPPPPPPSSPPPLPLSPPPPPVLSDTQRDQQLWRGPLCKGGVQYCEVLVRGQPSDFGQYTGVVHEPSGWPDTLDVTKRADLKSVRQSLNSCAVDQREVCRLYTSEGSEHCSGFLRFMDYLKQRDRAGVVKIPGGHGLWPRMLYIMPWTTEASAMLSVPARPADSLICVVLPSPRP